MRVREAPRLAHLVQWLRSLGESADEVERVSLEWLPAVQASGVDKAICFAHGHSLRVLAACWLDFPLIFGQSFPLDVSSCPSWDARRVAGGAALEQLSRWQQLLPAHARPSPSRGTARRG